VLGVLGALAVAALLLWGLTRGGGDEPAEPSAAATPADTGALAGEFEQLESEAARREQGKAPAPAAERPAPAGGEGGQTEREKAAAVQQVVLELNDSWVRGEMDRHMAFYADRVDFYGDRYTRAQVRGERERDLRTFDQDRQIRVLRQAVTFPSPDRAVALVDKEWEFRGESQRRTGAGRQEMVLERRDGRWVVVSERLREVFRSRQEPG
jgi:hypothetical protein